MYLADVARRVILVVLFDNRTTLGLVRLKMKADRRRADASCSSRCSRARAGRAARQPDILAGADDEIDQLFQ